MSRIEIVQNMPFPEYQAVAGVSKSFLDEFARCPLAGYEYLTQTAEPPSKAMILGSAVDCLVCEPNQFQSRFYVRPDTYDSDGTEKPWNGNSKACREWIASHRNKPVLTSEEYSEAVNMAGAVLAEPKAKQILAGCLTQASVFWEDECTKLQLKGRPDFYAPGRAIDLKVTRDASERAVSRTIAEYRYYVQAALYIDGLGANGIECEDFYFIFVEPGDRPKPNVRRLKPEAVNLGRIVYDQQLSKVKECFASAEWPGFSGNGKDVLDVDVPAYTYTTVDGSLTLKIGGEDMPL